MMHSNLLRDITFVCLAFQTLAAMAAEPLSTDVERWVLWGQGELKVVEVTSAGVNEREWSGWWNACSGDAQVEVKKTVNGRASAGMILVIHPGVFAFNGDMGFPEKFETEAWEEKQLYFMMLESVLRAVFVDGRPPPSKKAQIVNFMSSEPLKDNESILLAAPWRVSGTVVHDGVLKVRLHIVAGEKDVGHSDNGFQDLNFEGELAVRADNVLDGMTSLLGWRLYGFDAQSAGSTADFATVDALRTYLRPESPKPVGPSLCLHYSATS